MTTFYTVVSWLVILGYWVLIAGVTLRILMKRRAQFPPQWPGY